MTVKEAIEELKQFDENLEVCINIANELYEAEFDLSLKPRSVKLSNNTQSNQNNQYVEVFPVDFS